MIFASRQNDQTSQIIQVIILHSYYFAVHASKVANRDVRNKEKENDFSCISTSGWLI
jgi:hypothetical protein